MVLVTTLSLPLFFPILISMMSRHFEFMDYMRKVSHHVFIDLIPHIINKQQLHPLNKDV